MYLLEKKLLQKIYSFLESQSLRSWVLPLGNAAILGPETTTAQKNAPRRQEVCVCVLSSPSRATSVNEAEHNTN